MPESQSTATRAQQVRELFARLGGNIPISVLADAAMDEMIFLPEELRAHARHWVQSECRRALRQEDTRTHLPFACPIAPEEKSTAPEWKQLDFLTYEEAEFNLTERVQGVQDDYERIVAFHQWMLETFRRAPEIPLLVSQWHPKSRDAEVMR